MTVGEDRRGYVAGAWFATVAAATVLAGAVVGTLAVTANGASRPVEEDRQSRPTVVLEHGAFADGSGWNGVIQRLRADGYSVLAAANPLRGPHSDAAALRTVLDHIKGPNSRPPARMPSV